MTWSEQATQLLAHHGTGDGLIGYQPTVNYMASSRSTNPVKFTRPVCPWPKTASYKGSGPRTDAANWSCQ